MRRKITVFTGTRAEYGLMRTMISMLAQHDTVDLNILVSGAHLSADYGKTLSEITRDNFAPLHKVDIELTDNSPVGICSSMGKGIASYGNALQNLAPDLFVVLGDRYESFSAVAAASVVGVPVAHLYGGGTTQGAIDEVFRHAMTKMSHLHFVSCESNRQRVIQMGEDPARVWLVGSTGVENIHKLPVLTEQDVRGRLDLPSGVPYVVATYHPVTLDKSSSIEHVERLLNALREQDDLYYVFTGANADSGGRDINNFLQDNAAKNPRMRFFMSLGALLYINAARYAVGVVGNSSSGVIEIPSLKVPVLDIGDRQKGRERSEAVLHCSEQEQDIRNCIARLRTPELFEKARTIKNPFDFPGTSETIVNTLVNANLNGLLRKEFHTFSLS